MAGLLTEIGRLFDRMDRLPPILVLGLCRPARSHSVAALTYEQ